MRKALSLFLVLNLSLLTKVRGDTLVDTINDANDAVKSTDGPKPPCATCNGLRVEEPLPAWRKCLTELCPREPNTVQKALEDRVSAIQETYSDLPVIQAAIDSTVQREMREDELTLRALQDNKKITNSTAKTLFHHLKAGHNIGKIVTDPSGNVDRNATKKAFLDSGLAMDDFNATMKYYQVIQKVSQDMPTILSHGLDGVTPAEARRRCLEITKDMEAEISSIRKKIGARAEFMGDQGRELRKVRIESGALTHSILNDLRDDWVSWKVFGQFSKIQYAGSDLESTRIFPPDMKEKLQRRISDAKEYLAGRSSGLDNTALELRQTCANAIYTIKVLAPTESQVENLAKTEKEMRSLFLEHSGRFLSHHSASLVRKESEKWRAKMPLTANAHTKDFEQTLAGVSASNKSFEVALSTSTSDEVQFITAFRATASFTENNESKNYDELRNTCKGFTITTSGDFAQGGRDQNLINFSAFTAIDQQTRMDRMFHEYSHMVSHVIASTPDISDETKGWYKDVRECLNRQHGSDPQFEEEDFADLLAAASAPETMDKQCQTFGIKANQSFLEPYMHLHPNEHDKLHSGSFYLLLMQTRIRTGKIPSSCGETLRLKGENRLPENCLEKTTAAAQR